jgi:hypothetical protein
MAALFKSHRSIFEASPEDWKNYLLEKNDEQVFQIFWDKISSSISFVPAPLLGEFIAFFVAGEQSPLPYTETKWAALLATTSAALIEKINQALLKLPMYEGYNSLNFWISILEALPDDYYVQEFNHPRTFYGFSFLVDTWPKLTPRIPQSFSLEAYAYLLPYFKQKVPDYELFREKAEKAFNVFLLARRVIPDIYNHPLFPLLRRLQGLETQLTKEGSLRRSCVIQEILSDYFEEDIFGATDIAMIDPLEMIEERLIKSLREVKN